MARSRGRKSIMHRLLLGTYFLLGVGLFVSWYVAGKLVAPCPQVVGDAPVDVPAVPISFDSQSGSTIAGWRITAEPSKGVVLLLHGIRGSRLSMLERARFLFDAGYSIVMIDLQAHGESSGENITIGYLEQHDVTGAVNFTRKHYPGEAIGVVGVSLGGASALLASPLGIDALVLESVYPNLRDAVHNRVTQKLGPLSAIPAELLLLQLKPRLGFFPSELRPVDHISKVSCPIFLLSGTEDRHTTQRETENMFMLAQEPKELWLVKGAVHEDLFRVASQQYKRKLLSFLDRHMNVLDK